MLFFLLYTMFKMESINKIGSSTWMPQGGLATHILLITLFLNLEEWVLHMKCAYSGIAATLLKWLYSA
jgi:hypothetical protein